ncbi:MAG TPA: precorrin-3B C(17)-methyltransferase [Acidimicrobiales bacterium]|jgi:cobalt-precorrin 5A hydrolase / precorrin-3B C17-methyltransferase|nr:precorrin-3B C(17)-methyltransferase [Acidimicrobiales bacterium]
MTGPATVLAVSVTEAGRRLAERLPFEHAHGQVAETVRGRWQHVEGFVLFLATGAAVRIIAPLLDDKRTDPAVVCVDEAGRHVVALVGGHAAGANALARQVAALLGAEPVVTTATDAAGVPGLDALPGFVAVGDVSGVTAALLDGRLPLVEAGVDWPLPPGLTPLGGGPERVVVTDLATAPRPGTVVLHPPSLVAGVGTSTDAGPAAVAELVASALAGAGLAPASLGEVATIDRRAGHPAVTRLGLPVRSFGAGQLAGVAVPSPSTVVDGAVGTPSVAEAAALLAAGPGACLVVAKQKNAVATVAVARRSRPRGHLALVGLGPGGPEHRTPAAAAAVRRAQVVIGYGPYVEQAADLLTPAHELVPSPIGREVERARSALERAAAGRSVAVVCSGDAGVYAMASIVLELAGEVAPGLDIEVVPGVTAASAAAAILGAPLGHDHVSISLSDLLTPWDVIEGRLRAAADSDLVVALYNPRSRTRDWQLEAARKILLGSRPDSTPVGVVTDAGRPGEKAVVTTLGDLDPADVGMTTCVVIGSSATAVVDARMVTPRGYRP